VDHRHSWGRMGDAEHSRILRLDGAQGSGEHNARAFPAAFFAVSDTKSPKLRPQRRTLSPLRNDSLVVLSTSPVIQTYRPDN
jgi:hypothetical protein